MAIIGSAIHVYTANLHLFGAESRARQSVAQHDGLDCSLGIKLGVGTLPEREHLPAENAKGPDVACRCVDLVKHCSSENPINKRYK